jgi:hypothetical protein
MELTSNVECAQSTQGVIRAYTSWINSERSVSRVGVNQSSIELFESRFIDGRIYCKIRRDPLTTVDGNVIDLESDAHYLLLAGGIEITENSVGSHNENRDSTSERLSLTSPPTEIPPTQPTSESPPSDNSIYDGCGTQKLCFGMPDGCITNRNCQLMSSARRVNEEYFEFELLSNRKKIKLKKKI